MSLSTEIERFSIIAETKFAVEDFRKRIQAVTASAFRELLLIDQFLARFWFLLYSYLRTR
jgi:hypothetical protein